MDELNTWTWVVGSLSGLPSVNGLDSRVTRKARLSQVVAPYRVDCRPSVVALEINANREVLVSWSDSTRGHYAYQRWVIGTSRGNGRCALSGRSIRRGDQVYRPQWRAADCPANGAEMILAVALDTMDIPGTCADEVGAVY